MDNKKDKIKYQNSKKVSIIVFFPGDELFFTYVYISEK